MTCYYFEKIFNNATILFMRLDKMLANSGYGTRSEVRKLITRGLVCINGEVCKDAGQNVGDTDTVELDGAKCSSKEHLYFKFDKPDGVLTAMEDKRLPTIADFIPASLMTKKLSPVGRLDYHTTGLLIITNDGELSHRLTSPKYKIPKTYQITFEGQKITDDMVNTFAEGFTLDDMDTPVKLAPSTLVPVDDNHCLLTIKEGKTHQVRRMMAKFNRSVVELRRVSIGDIKVPEQKEGELIEMPSSEIEYLLKATGITK